MTGGNIDENSTCLFFWNVYKFISIQNERCRWEKGIEAEIWAVAQDKAESDMEKADVLLIGPQMRFLFKRISKVADEKGVPVEVIDPISYGRIDGEAVLDKALELIQKKV